MSYKKITLKHNPSTEVFEYFKNRIINDFNAESIEDIKYFDFIINHLKLTLHQEHYLGISIFPTMLEKATLEENNATEYYAMKLLCSENLYANFVTLKDGSKIRIDILLDNILIARSNKGKFNFKPSQINNISFELCDICEDSFDEYWENDKFFICKNCFNEFIQDENYFDKLLKMKREEILEF
ncbi:hypothetical protein PG637_02775 [Riemerella anatipestifer]|nr:hypothetical protein [Riemerella anatipestifer]MDY3324594.1 hypothetical protein [Riemerella anatipestifer]MDY3353404.1 hypothetical protein [Riemerella anatipestifer]